MAIGCGEKDAPSSAPSRDCPRAIWARPARAGSDIRVVGSWDDWKTPGTLLDARADGWHTKRIDVPEGEYEYLISEGGEKRLDIYEPLTSFRGDEEVSVLRVPACDAPEIRVDAVETEAPRHDDRDRVTLNGRATIRATFLRGSSGSHLSPRSIAVVSDAETLRSPLPFRAIDVDAATGSIAIAIDDLRRGKHFVRLAAADEAGRKHEQRVAIFVEPLAATPADAVIYHIFVDRFRAPDGAALAPPPSPAHRAGGTLDGVRAELENGTFEALGVSTLWLSPLATTPSEARIGRSGRLEEGYHGYWQLDTRAVDPRLGGDAALDRLVEAAHRRGMSILVDIVPNHLYERHPRYLEHQRDGWFHDAPAKCVCGIDEGCSWSTEIEHCWFTDFLPDYRFQHPDVMRVAAEDAAYWMTRFQVDGVRIDAVPMMPRAASRRIVDALHATAAPASASFALGEVFTGTDGFPTIRQYLGPGGLSSAFDFPLMWTMRDAIATDASGFVEIDTVREQGDAAFAGSGSLLARMIDNHDTSRFLSEAAGNGGQHAWDDPPPTPTAEAPYERLKLGLALLYTLSGIPVLYYGDEIGLAGATDPDSRRVMPSLADVAFQQARVGIVARKLGALRRESEALCRGAHRTVSVDRDTYVFTRTVAGGRPTVVLLSKKSRAVTIDPNTLPAGNYVDEFSREYFTVTPDAATSIRMNAISFRILTPAP
jgi:glycosidase